MLAPAVPHNGFLSCDQLGNACMKAPSSIRFRRGAPLCLLEIPVSHAEEEICLWIFANEAHVVFSLAFNWLIGIIHELLLLFTKLILDSR